MAVAEEEQLACRVHHSSRSDGWSEELSKGTKVQEHQLLATNASGLMSGFCTGLLLGLMTAGKEVCSHKMTTERSHWKEKGCFSSDILMCMHVLMLVCIKIFLVITLNEIILYQQVHTIERDSLFVCSTVVTVLGY